MATFVRVLCVTFAFVAVALISSAHAATHEAAPCCHLAPQATAAARDDVRIEESTPADKEAIERQGTCPVMGTKLGAHGKPLKATYKEKSLYLCCKGCVAKLKKDPERYFGK